MNKYWNEKTKKLDPYICGEQPKDKRYIKLNTNENPYSPSPKVIEAIKKSAEANLNLYPDPICTELSETIAKYYNLDAGQVFIGNGSDEVLAFSFEAFFGPEKEILSLDITYSFYPVYAHLFDLKYTRIPLNEDFSVPAEKFLIDNGGIVIANPNAPTGKYLSVEDIEKIVKYNYMNCQKVVIIDEAYIDFGGKSCVSLIDKYPNLLVVQTFSKSRSLAGLRVGFAMGHKNLIEALGRIKDSINSYTVGRLPLAGAVESIKDEKYFIETIDKIVKTREWVTNKLTEINFEVLESTANFIFAKHNTRRADELYVQLKEKGVLVRYFNKPRIDNYLRITIGSDEEMQKFIEVLESILTSD